MHEKLEVPSTTGEALDERLPSVGQPRLQSLLAEYGYVGQSQRDEVGRLVGSWVALAALVSVTTAFLGSSYSDGNIALIAPFGVVAWCLFQLAVLSGIQTRAAYLSQLESRINNELSDDLLQYETRGQRFWVALPGWGRLSPWFTAYVLIGLLVLGLYVGFGAAAWNKVGTTSAKSALVSAMSIGFVVLVIQALFTLRFVEEWRQDLLDHLPAVQ